MPTKCGDVHHTTDAGVLCSSRRPIVTPPVAAMLPLLAHLAALLLLTNDPVLRVAAVTPNNARRTFSRLGCCFPVAAGSRGGERGIVCGSCTSSDGGEGRRRIVATVSVAPRRRTEVINIASDDSSMDPSSSFGAVLMAAATTMRGGGGRGQVGDGRAASTSTELRISPPATSVDGHVPPYRPLPDSTTSPTPDTDDADPISIATAITIAIRHLVTPDRCLRAVSLVGAYYLARAIFRGMKDLVDELYDEATREEHDQPLVSEDVIADLSSSMMASVVGESGASPSDSTSGGLGERGQKNGIYNLGGWRGGPPGENGRDQTGVSGAAANKVQRQRRAQRLSPRHRHARSLILKLHSAGFPLEAQVQEAHQNLLRRQQAKGIAPSSQAPAPPSGIRTAESVLKSLTKSEGQLLTSCLLTPEDLGGGSGGNGNEETNPWDQIGGLDDVKESLLDLTYPLLASPTDGSAARQYGGLLSHPPGVLLFGPPGCGKTLLARTLARTAGARFLSVAPSSLLRKFVGETNLNVRALFSLARKLQPCVVFVDEMDGLFRERQSSGGQGHDEHDVSRDLKTEFMQLWDGIASTKGGGGGDSSPPDRVLVIGATNRPFDVDSAFLRRMPRSYFVGLPDYDARVSVLMAALSAGVPVTPDFDVGRIAAETEGYSPSDLGEVLRTAALFPLREARAAAAAASGQRPPGVSPSPLPPLRNLSTEDVLRALGTVSPTPYSPAYRAALAEYASRCGAHRHHQPIDGSSSSSTVFPHDGDDAMMGRSTNHGDGFFGGGAGAMNDGGPGGSYLNYHGAEDDDESSDMYTEDEDEDELSSDFD